MTERSVELFADGGRATRLHTRLRWWWCPFPLIEAEVPKNGDVLEVGCGHGLLSLYLGLQSRQRHVAGVDIDRDKIAEANDALSRLHPSEADVTFETVDPGFVPTGEWDAIVIADVLYLLPEDTQRALLEAAAGALADGGVLVVKEMGLRPRWKLQWNRVQETLATRVFRVTDSVGRGLSFVDPDVMGGWLAAAGLEVRHRRIDRGYPWPHHLIAGRRPDHRAASAAETASTKASTSASSL
ncbi:MAG TPA: class I SAM-dependent methyltransferase [Acidimicrobiales bacterium]|jgi:SAM-dependent methyltransferase